MICCSVKSLPPTTIVSAALAVATTPAPATQAAATRIRFNIFMLVTSKIASSKTSTPHIAALLTQRINAARNQQERSTGHQGVHRHRQQGRRYRAGQHHPRSEERRVGKAWGSTGGSRWSPYH